MSISLLLLVSEQSTQDTDGTNRDADIWQFWIHKERAFSDGLLQNQVLS